MKNLTLAFWVQHLAFHSANIGMFYSTTWAQKLNNYENKNIKNSITYNKYRNKAFIKKNVENYNNEKNVVNIIKEKVKKAIQEIFTKIRNELNKREDWLLDEVDNIFENKFNIENINNILKGKK